MKLIKHSMLALGLSVAGVASVTGAAQAQTNYPEQPIRIVVPWAPGGSSDALARIVAQALTEELGQNVLVENIAGAGGRTGTAQVVNAEPDGYTIAFGNMGSLAGIMGLFTENPYDPRTDVEPIGILANVPMVLAVSKGTGIESLDVFMETLETQGDVINFGTAGYGATSDLAPLLFLNVTGLEATRIPYTGVGPALNDLAGNAIDALIDQTVTLINAHNNEQATALAVTGDSRVAQLPDIPTFAEAGVPEFDMAVWNALVVPNGTPQEIIDRLVDALDTVLDSEGLGERYATLGVPIPAPETRGPQYLDALIDSEVDRWIGIIDAAGGPQE